MPPTPPIQQDQYLVHHQGLVQGPFDVDFVEAMIMSDVYPVSVIVEKVGTSVRTPFSDVPVRRKIPPLRSASQTGSIPSVPTAVNPRHKKAESESGVGRILGVVAVLVVIFLVANAASSKKPASSQFAPTSTSSSSSNTYSPAAPTSPHRPSTSYPASKATDTMVYRDASGRTYRVSNSDYYRLSGMRTSLSLKQSGMDAEDARLQSLAAEVDRDRATLNSYSQSSVDSFNWKVNQVNSMNSRVQSLVNDYNRDVNAFNAELERVGTPIR